MSEYQLTTEILKLSQSQKWDEAKLEWKLLNIYKEDEPFTCLCGHNPIIEICILKNIKNGNEAVVGNVCVKKFLGLPSDKIFNAITKISEDIHNALNPEAIVHAFEQGWIDDWKKNFYLDTWRKRKLTQPQMAKRIEINKKVLRNVINKFNKRK